MRTNFYIKDILEMKKDIFYKKGHNAPFAEGTSRLNLKDPYLQYILKKSERIVAGIHLVTNFMSDTEPIKKSIRQSTLNILDNALSVSRSVRSPNNGEPLFEMAKEIERLVSYLEVSFLAGSVSYMNLSVLREEIGVLEGFLEEKGVFLNPTLLSKSALSTSSFEEKKYRQPMDAWKEKDKNPNYISDYHNSPQDSERAPMISSPSDREEVERKAFLTTFGSNKVLLRDSEPKRKGNRRVSILNLARSKKNLTIKDFIQVVEGCSEKTIQREISSLVNEGILRKEGEKRWSTYSLI
ncbi:MAG: hypothetical protein Q8P52_01575 [bacterium]|nr:hypothetical protein [bacterium]